MSRDDAVSPRTLENGERSKRKGVREREGKGKGRERERERGWKGKRKREVKVKVKQGEAKEKGQGKGEGKGKAKRKEKGTERKGKRTREGKERKADRRRKETERKEQNRREKKGRKENQKGKERKGMGCWAFVAGQCISVSHQGCSRASRAAQRFSGSVSMSPLMYCLPKGTDRIVSHAVSARIKPGEPWPYPTAGTCSFHRCHRHALIPTSKPTGTQRTSFGHIVPVG